MVLKFYGNPYSTAAHRVGVVLHELKGVKFESITVDISTGKHKTEEYKEKQPYGLVPYIDDDGFVLYESRAICRYLCDKYAAQGGAQLVPAGKGTQAIALFEQAASSEVANFDAFAGKVIFQKYYAPYLGKSTDEAIVKENLEKLENTLEVYEKILSKQKYLVGDQISLVDLYHLPVGDLLEKTGTFKLEDKPNVARWWKDISSRPSWQAVRIKD